MDYQIIQCSNFMQILAFACHMANLFVDGLQELAALIDLIADLITLSVAGCMGAQIYHEIKKDDMQRAQGIAVQTFAPQAALPVAIAVPVPNQTIQRT